MPGDGGRTLLADLRKNQLVKQWEGKDHAGGSHPQSAAR